MRRFIYITLTIACGTVFGVLAFLAPDYSSKARSVVLQNVFSSICASFFFFITLDVGQIIRDAFYRRQFRRFFGELSKHPLFVYPDFVLNDASKLQVKDLPPSDVYRKAGNQYPGSRFIDVPKIVASNDLQGLVIVSAEFGKYSGGVSPTLITDGSAVENCARSFISFGLTSNLVTSLYLNSHQESLLFTINDLANNPQINIPNQNGEGRTFGRDERAQHGLILRYRPNPEEYPDRFWFICAGLAAAGTPAAAWKLVHNWKGYHRRFGSRDFVVIFKTSNDVNAYMRSDEVYPISKKEPN